MRISLPSFAVGALAATLLAVPATALAGLAAPDKHPKAYDGTSPALHMRPVSFVVGSSIDAAEPPGDEACSAAIWNGATLRMRWSGFDRVSGLAGYDVWAAGPSHGGAEKLVEATSSTSHTYAGTNYTGDCGGGSDVDNHYWVVSKDNRGNTASTHQVGQHFDVWTERGVDVTGERAALPLTKTGTWTSSSCTCSNHGKTLYSTAKGASLTYRVTTTRPGQVLALVVGKNTNRGTVKIRVDGGATKAVSTYASSPRHRVIVWQKVLGVGTHTLELTNAGTPGHSRVAVDTLMLTDGQTSQSPPDLPEG
jgi:hypothetical protein